MNTGLFGGTFNPLHNGHIETIKYVADTFALDRVFFIPSAVPPHKSSQVLASARDRFSMVSKSLEQVSGKYNFLASDIELKRKGPSFTIDTIREFEKKEGMDNDLFFIMGSDAFLEIQTWKNFKEIFDETCVIIMVREQMQDKRALIEEIKSCVKTNISENYSLSFKGEKFFHKNKKDIYISHVPKISVSSTMIRKLVKRGDAIDKLVPAAVTGQIHEKGLYL